MTVSTAFFSIRTLSVASADGVMLRTAEYAIDDMIPVVGGAISDITDVMAGGILMIKNAVGLIAFVIIALQALSPVVFLCLSMVSFKAGAAVSKMIGADSLAGMYGNISKSMMLFIVCCISIIAIIAIIIIISLAAANRIMMYR